MSPIALFGLASLAGLAWIILDAWARSERVMLSPEEVAALMEMTG